MAFQSRFPPHESHDREIDELPTAAGVRKLVIDVREACKKEARLMGELKALWVALDLPGE